MTQFRCIYCQHIDEYETQGSSCNKCGHENKLTAWINIPNMRTKAAPLPVNGFNRGLEHLDRDLDILDGKGTV